MHSSQQPVMSRKAGILARSLQPWKRRHPWVSSNFSKDSQKSIITSILLISLWPHWSHPEPKPQFRKGEHRNPNALFECWWQIPQCAIRHEIFWLKANFSGNPPETWTARGYLRCSPVFHHMLLPNGWRYWSCYFDLNTVHSSDFACAKHQSKYLFGYILGGSTGSTYTFVSKTVRKIILCKTWDLTA